MSEEAVFIMIHPPEMNITLNITWSENNHRKISKLIWKNYNKKNTMNIETNTNHLGSLGQSDVHLGLFDAGHLTLSSLEETQEP